jgi:ATP-dependent RNA helicase RhlE
MNFASLDLAPDLQKGIEACGYKKMTLIQEQAIVPARQGKDILAIAQTGTGKTAAFAIPILQRMINSADESLETKPRALILTPTRELAAQLAQTIDAYAEFLPLNVSAVFGGTKLTSEAKKLEAGVDVLIATPGRLLEHIAESNVTLAGVEYVVLDESDRMLDMGFVSDVQTILQRTRKKRQTALFSATLSGAVNELAHKILHNHIEIRTTKANSAADTVEHVVYPVEERRKIDLFKDLLTKHNWYRVLVFTSTTHQADKLHKALREAKVLCAVCHGDKRQNARKRALADFRSSKIQVLIATEVAARGLDIPDMDFVLNYNLPYLAEDYVHRIGRTGRAGNTGYAISFVSREEERSLESIERLIGSRIKRIAQHGFEVSDRDTLISKVSQQKRPGRLNKAGNTKIDKS